MSESYLTRQAWYAALAGVVALLLGLTAAPATAQTPDTAVVNRAALSYQTENGLQGSATAEALVLVRRSAGAGVRLVSSQNVVLQPGERRVFAHQLSNVGSGPDSFRMQLDGPAGWSVQLFLDLNGDGVLGPEDVPVSGPLSLDRGASVALLLVVTVPANAADIVNAPVDVRATSTTNAEVSDAVRNTITVRRTVAALTLGKIVDRAEATRGDTLLYTITYTNGGDGNAPEARITDLLPSGTRFVSGSLRLNDLPLTDAADGDAGTVERAGDGRDQVTVQLGSLAPAAAGTLTFRAVVTSTTPTTLANVAGLASGDVQVTSPVAETRVSAPAGAQIEVTKRAGLLEASLGDAIPYLVTIRNPGQSPLTGLVIHDQLPEGVQFVPERLSGADSVRVNGRNLRIWFAGPLAPGQEHQIRYVVSLIAPGTATALENRVSVEAEDGRVRSDTATAWVRVRRGFTLQNRTLIGKVWFDANNNGRQDAGETGVAGVEVWSADGEVVVTDVEGRFSFRNMRPGVHALRLDTLGLPANQALVSSDAAIARVRMDGWTTPRADFRVVPRTRTVMVAGAGAAVGVALENARSAEAVTDTTRVTALRVAPLRGDAARQEEDAAAFLKGPTIRFISPVDGVVSGTNRLYVGVRGEPGAKVRLFNGTKLIGEEQLRPDGQMDFVGVELAPGPQHLRVWMRNSWNNEMWDSVAVHRAGAITHFEAEEATLRAESQDVHTVQVRIADEWGVSVPGGVITVEADGARITGSDVDRSSIGLQLTVGPDGMLSVPVRAGQLVGPGELRFAAGKVTGRVPLRVLPSSRSLIAVGAAQIGIGAAPESFGAVTMKGAIGRETSLSVSYDSRRGDPHDDFFGRGYDPLDEGRYPALGDASERRVLSGTTQTLSARVERGYSWVELGDIDTGDFSGGGRLATYRRALTGVGARIATGPVTWRAFGSVTDQVLSQLQVRGEGTSGPYRFGGTIRPGTERIAVEVRSRENAAIVIAREELHRFTDYQIDYFTGEVLLQRPLPASDPSGNPLFLVAIIEQRTGGESRLVGGARMDVDASKFLGLSKTDSAGVFLLGVHDAGESAIGTVGHDLLGGGLSVRRGALRAGAELLRAESLDSAAFAGRASLGWSLLNDRARIEGEWTRIGAGFVPGLDPRLSAGVQDVRLSGNVRVAEGSRLRLTHTRQRFDGFGAERHSTLLSAEQQVLGRALTSEGGIATDILGAGLDRASTSFVTGKMRLPVSPRLAVWLEGSQALANDPAMPVGQVRPNQIGTGVSYRVFRGTQLEGIHRWVGIGNDSASYSVTSVKLRTESLFGGPFWGGLDHAAAGTSSNSAVLGWSPRMRMAGGWSVDGMLERRIGLDRAPLLDPIRALPFPQLERDRWSTGLGAQWLPMDSVGRFTVQGEVHGGELSRGRKFELTGEAPMGLAAAFLTRHDWWQEERETGQGMQLSRRDRSLVGLALRPAESNTVNVLGKLEWRRNINPGLGTRFSGMGEEQRLIGAMDAIWGPRPGSELAGRYAARLMLSGDPLISADSASVNSLAHYVGGRADQGVRGPFRARLDGRLLVDGSGLSRWNMAPSLLVTLVGRIDVEGGYRFGDLQDADFATQGGNGFYATFGVRFTESALRGAAGFWRERVAAER